MSLKSWLNERPGAAVIDAEEAQRRVESSAAPFDPRTEVSADAKAIISRLTFLLFWLPLGIAALCVLAYALAR